MLELDVGSYFMAIPTALETQPLTLTILGRMIYEIRNLCQLWFEELRIERLKNPFRQPLKNNAIPRVLELALTSDLALPPHIPKAHSFSRLQVAPSLPT